MKLIDKYKIFEEFKNTSKDKFNKFAECKFISKAMKDLHSFIVAPGSRNGGLDKRTVEVFFGFRPFDSKQYFQNFEIETELEMEYGATLHYHQLDNGNVIVSLYPARTKSLKVIEESIILDYIKNPKYLLKDKHLLKHLKMLSAYMNKTALEGDPTVVDKIKVWYLKNFKEVIINKKIHNPKYKKVVFEMIKFVLTIGLSGFLIYIISIFTNPNAILNDRLMKVIANQNEIINQLNSQSKNNFTDLDRKIEIINKDLKYIMDKINK